MAVILAVYIFLSLYTGTALGESCRVYCTKTARTSTSCGWFGLSRCTTYKTVSSSCECGYGWRHDGECSGTCGAGIQKFVSESQCGCPVLRKTESCQNNKPCPVDGVWTEWYTDRTSCSHSCGGGIRTIYKHRQCVGRAYGGRDCQGNSSRTETETCNTQKCPPPPNPCPSGPCRNGATCVDNRDGTFHCDCVKGYAGVLCQTDVQAPVVTNCMDNFTVHIKSSKATVDWSVPKFTDPMGTEVNVISNYGSNSSEFPWGDFTVQYVATKISNAMQAKCIFVISIRPTPCKPLNIPVSGAKVCNGWGEDYAQICMVFCSEKASLPAGEDHRQLWVCGASGQWVPNRPLPNCIAEVFAPGVPVDYNADSYKYKSCTEDQDAIRDTYLNRLKTSSFKQACNMTDGCQLDRVKLDCD